MDHESGVGREGKQSGCQAFQQLHMLVQLRPLAASHQLKQLVRSPNPVAQKGAGAFHPPKVHHPDASPAVLVLVGGTDAPPGGAELLAALAGGVEQLVIGKHQVGPIGHEQPAGGIDAPLVKAVQLVKQVLRLQHHAVTDDTGDPGMQDAGGDLPENELFVADDHGMAGVGAALIAHHQVAPARPARRPACPSPRLPTVPRPPPCRWSSRRTCRLPAGTTKRAPCGAPESSGKPIAPQLKGQFDASALPIRSAVSRESPSGVSAGV